MDYFYFATFQVQWFNFGQKYVNQNTAAQVAKTSHLAIFPV